MKLLCFLFTLFFCSVTSGRVIQKTYSYGQVNDIQPTSDGGFVLTGILKTNSNDKCYLMKFDSLGQVSWMKGYNDLIEFYSYGVSVIHLPDEGYLFGGIMFHDTISNEQFMLSKCDTAGNLLWSREYGNAFDDDELSDMLMLNDGILLAGHTTSFGPGGEDFFLIKTDSSGNTIWMNSFGTNYDERCVSILPFQGGFVAGGYSQNGTADMFLLFLDSAANILNTIKLDMPGQQRLYSMVADLNGDLVLAGTSEDSNHSPQALFVKVNSSGNVIWSKLLTDDESIPFQIKNSSSGYVVVGASMKSVQKENGFVMELDPTCNILSEDYFGDSTGCVFNSFIQLNDTMQLAGYFTKPGALFPSVYLNRYVSGDTTCNHYSQNSTLQNVICNPVSVTWQKSSQTEQLIIPVVLGQDVTWSDSIVCDVNPYAAELFSKKTFNMLPNPANGYTSLTLPTGVNDCNVSVLNSSGNLIFNFRATSKQVMIPTEGMIPGMYEIRLWNHSFSTTQRLIIQR